MATPKFGSFSGRAGHLVILLDTLVARRWGRGTHPYEISLNREIAISFNQLCELLGSHEKVDEPHEKIDESHEKIDESRRSVACCRMLGNCNGRTDFGKRNTLDWASDGSLYNRT